MKTELFDFDLPRSAIAQRPVTPRDAAKLLHVGAALVDLTMRDLPTLLDTGDLMVFNDTRVIPARLIGVRDAARIEVTLHKQESPSSEGLARWWAFAKPAKKIAPDDRLVFSSELCADVLSKNGSEVFLRFNHAPDQLHALLETTGTLPLPPYIRRDNGADQQDRQDYQTLFAREAGAVAAPTAGLHYTERLMTHLTEQGIRTTTLTLHVGAGTFLPVKVDKIQDHNMHSENGCLDAEATALINETRERGGRIIAVGTTSLRLLESAADASGRVSPWQGATDIFITPGYRFKVVDALLTNFHLPRSTLFMLVAAFCGLERMKAAYRHALATNYRFYSYGDCSLLERADRT